MVAVAELRVDESGRPNREFRRELRQVANARNAVTVVMAYAMIAAIVGVAAWAHNPFVYVAAFVLMPGIHIRLFVLGHEAAHGVLLTNRKINDFVWLWIIS